MGTFKYTRMPFGIKSAPSAFQRIMTDLMGDMQGVLCYMDDIMIAAPDKNTLQVRVDQVINKLRKNNVVINKDKSTYNCESIEWLGYEISKYGIRPTVQKTRQILTLSKPANLKGVRQLLGVINYYGKFIPHLASVAEPLHALLRKNTTFHWGKAQIKALEEIQKRISMRPALAPFQTSDQEVVLKCDACDSGMGAVLEQRQPDGILAPVLYWSSKFRAYEANYSTGEKEALACVSAVTKLRKYLLGRHFVLETDHRALETLLSQSKIKRTVARVERWREKLACFDYTIRYIKGKDNTIADWLSRTARKVNHNEVRLTEELVINSVRSEQEIFISDYGTKLQKLADCLKTNRWNIEDKKVFTEYYKYKNDLTEWRGLIFYKRYRFVPAECNRSQIIEEAHKLHQGITKTRLRIAEYFWWPKWTQEAETFIRSCETCTLSDRTKKVSSTPLVPVVLPRGPWDKVAVDLKGPLSIPSCKYLFVMVDYYSKWPEVIRIGNIRSKTIIETMKNIFTRLGLPREIVSDNGTQFVSGETKQFLEQLKIKHRTVALYAPSQNGLVERFNRVLSEKISESKQFGWDLKRTIDSTLYHYRSTPHATTRISPFEAMFGRPMRTNMSHFFPSNKERQIKSINRNAINDKIKKIKEKIDLSKAAKNRNFIAGDLIQIRGQDNKFGPLKKVKEVRKTSIVTQDGKVWPMSRVFLKKSYSKEK